MPTKQRQTPTDQSAVTLTRPNGQSATFGPMPERDAALVAAVAHVTGHGATIQTAR